MRLKGSEVTKWRTWERGRGCHQRTTIGEGEQLEGGDESNEWVPHGMERRGKEEAGWQLLHKLGQPKRRIGGSAP